MPEGLGDEGRALTARARGLIVQHFEGLRARFGSPGLMLTSPLVRTVQTAQLLAVVLGYDGPLKAHRALLPDMPVGAIEGVLDAHTETDVVLVGHNPSMTAMAAHLLGRSSFPKPVVPGTVVCIERRQLVFYAPPGQPVVGAID